MKKTIAIPVIVVLLLALAGTTAYGLWNRDRLGQAAAQLGTCQKAVTIVGRKAAKFARAEQRGMFISLHERKDVVAQMDRGNALWIQILDPASGMVSACEAQWPRRGEWKTDVLIGG